MGVQLSWQVPVSGIAALPGEKPVVLAPALEDGAYFQTSRATSTTRSSLRHCSSSVSALP
jgi:hypothetical protein